MSAKIGDPGNTGNEACRRQGRRPCFGTRRLRVKAGDRPFARMIGALVVAIALLSLAAATASAKLQWEPKYTFGPDGTPATEFKGAELVSYHNAEDRLYVYDSVYPQNSSLYGFHREEP